MRSKRLLVMLLAFCMVFSLVAPAASAVAAPENSIVNINDNADKFVTTDKNTASPFENGLLAGKDTLQSVPTVRDNPITKVEVQTQGGWQITPAEPSDTSLLVSDVPDCIEELRKAAEIYSADEVVTAFVVMEDQPLAESYTSPSLVSASAEKALIEKQDAVISSIEKTVLKGKELEVRYQFTYLTNSFSIETKFENLEKIAYIKGVKSVFVMPIYNPCVTSTPNTAASGAMTGVDTVWQDLGYTGTGMKIAVIDTGLDLDHPSFAADPQTNENSMTVEDIEAVLEDLNAYKARPKTAASDLYRSEKVPYAFNYVDVSLRADHSMDGQGDHGTHVAGIAAANAVDGTSVVGMAPDAQIIVMKVFGAAGGAYTDDIVAALEDAMTLGCDAVNASLGSPAGFHSTDTEIDLIYARLASQDIIATISAGNEGTSSYGNMWGTNLNRTQNPDNATVGSPSTYVNSFSIASAENAVVMTNYFALADGTKVFYMDSIEYLYGETYACMANLAGQELEYVIVPGLGSAEDVASVDLEGKVAVIMRGELSFAEKVSNAEAAGAVAVIIWNNNDTDNIFSFGMTTAGSDGSIPGIPVCLITLTDGNKMEAAEVKTIAPTAELAPRAANGGQMSSFSSWGVAPDLSLVPDITGIGGNVYSCYDGGQYGLMSGTSMSAPQLAGISALVLEYLHSKYPDATDGELREVALALMMSTADPIIDSTTGLEASPRQQGAGLVDAAEAVTNQAYLTVGGNRPKAELGDNENGKFVFSFEIHNLSDEDKTYTLSSSLLTEDVIDYGVAYFMAGYDRALTGSVTFNKDTVTVREGGKANVTVTVTLSEEDKAYFQECWENGGYVEGYVYLANEEGEVEMNLPFLGFYGDWTDAPAFDTAYWYDNSFWGVSPATGLPEGDEYYNVIWTDLAGTSWVLGFNPYSGAVTDANGNIMYDPANNVVSPNGDGALDGFDDIYLSLLRNAKTLTFTYTVDGEVVHEEVYDNVSKTMYISAYGQVVPWLYSWYGTGFYNFTDKNGKVLADGTEVLLTIDAYVDYGTGGNNTIQIPITVDTTAPELLQVYEQANEDGTHYLGVQVADNVSLASVVLMSASGTAIYDQAYDVTMQDLGDGTMLAVFDITDLGTEFTVAVCDYGANEGYYKVTYTSAEDGNLPEMDTDLLYAYRVLDDHIFSDHMYGWVSMNKPTSAEDYANISVWTDDYLEYAAINAAEYAGGKIFAVDAVYNLVVMDPGLWNRQTVCNLGVNVIDMTFDDSTDTMYVLSKQGYYTYLYSMDLLTGELTQLKSYGYYYYGPWAIADDDNGTIYAIKYNSANIYVLDTANNYAMTAVTHNDADVLITDSTGANVTPSAYAQSITYIDGILYWAYLYSPYYGSYTSELISINTADWTSFAVPYAAQAYNTDGELVEYYPGTELVGLLSLVETDYQLPESTEASSIFLDTTSLIMQVGQSTRLTAYPLPWNYKMNDVEWTSSDESVVTVDANGMVVAVGEGSATITATHGELTATCDVNVALVEGSFNAYNYYSADGYYGYMINVDLETMDYYLDNLAPIDFVAGDYNGHDGYYYGYDQGGQLYRYDLVNNEVTPLGASMGTYPVDMAYDYSSGLMYVLVTNYNTYESKLYVVNMNNGKLMEMGAGQGLLTLACDTEGKLYTVDMSGYLCELNIVDYSAYGMGYYLETMPIMEESFGEVYMLQSMCYDHNNDVLLWACCDNVTVYWIDVNAETPFAISLGDPTESGVMEFVGLYVVPEEIPELADTAVESVTAEDMLVLTGYEKIADVTVAPFNATCQNLILTSNDTSVVEVTANGNLKGVSEGTATVTATLNDTVGGQTHEVTFTVTVMDPADNMNAHLLTDVTTMNAQLWIELNPSNPSAYEMLAYFDYTIFTQEYYNGKIYTYGYDSYDWEANWQFFVLDAETYAIETQIDMGEAFPYVYDMTYDYNTSTMYVLAGAGEDDTSLYVADMNSGKLTLLLETEPLFMSLAAGPDGVLYAMEQSSQEMDWETWETVYTNAKLYTIDPLTCTVTLVGDTGITCNMINSMAYDYDTDTLYWTPFAQTTAYVSHLAVVDTETGAASSLGTIGTAGAQVGGLYFVCDSFPEEDNTVLYNLLMATSKVGLTVGQTAELSAVTMPMNLDADIIWTSSDESIATVDENGVVTAVAQGKAIITASVTVGDVTKTATASVGVLKADASFLTYNATAGGWASISRADTTVVTNLTEGEDEAQVTAITAVGADVYGYDVNNQLFKLNTRTYERTNIGDGLGLEVDTESGFIFEVRDMAYDVANDRVLVLGATMLWDEDYGEYSEIYDGCGIYSVDLTTGALELLYTLGDYYYVFAMAVDTEGNVYFYNTFNDDVTKLNLTSGVTSTVISLQNQSLYGDYSYDYALYYDDLTGTLFLLFTSNGRFYKMHTIDAATGALTQGDYVGDVWLEPSGYGYDVYTGNDFTGLTFISVEPEEPAVKNGLVVDEDGEIRYYVDGVAIYAGLVQDDEGYYYYINSTKKAVRSCTYGIGEGKTNGLLPAGYYTFGDDGRMIDPPVDEEGLKNGLYTDADGEIRYYVDGVATYAGLVQDAEGNYYYINSSKTAVKNCTYGISAAKTNGLLPAGQYTFGADGKMIDPPTTETEEPAVKNGLVVDEDGEIRYYVDGVATYAGLVQDDEGNYYYINSTKKAVKNCTYGIGASKTNGLLPAGTYTFGADGKMIR